MTISIVWTRRIGRCEELVFASDSRLSGDGAVMDYCPKIITLPRSDCAICFAGYTGTAYPLMSQLALAIQAHAPMLRRSMDIKRVLHHALRIFDSMASSLKASVLNPSEELQKNLEDPAVTFILGGYSWIDKEFDFWNVGFNFREKRFIAKHPACVLTHPKARRVFLGNEHTATQNSNIFLGKIAFGGDQGQVAENRFVSLMSQRLNYDNVDVLQDARLNLEPFEVLRDMLRDPDKSHTIGGAPQIVKVYQHMNASPIAIYWPNKEAGQVSLLGRPVLGYESIDFWILDPDRLRTSHPRYSREEEEEDRLIVMELDVRDDTE